MSIIDVRQKVIIRHPCLVVATGLASKDKRWEIRYRSKECPCTFTCPDINTLLLLHIHPTLMPHVALFEVARAEVRVVGSSLQYLCIVTGLFSGASFV